MAALVTGLNECGVDLKQADFFITHMHADHSGLVSALAGEGSSIYFGQADSEIIRSTTPEQWAKMIDSAHKCGIPRDELVRAVGNHPGRSYSSSNSLDLHILGDGDSVGVGDYSFSCIETPGHTPGHICLYEPSKKVLVCGDHILLDGVDRPKGALVLRWTAAITRAEDVGQDTSSVHPRFKEADRLLPITGKAADLARELGVTDGADVRARGRAIYDNVLATMVYDKVAEGWGKGDFARACEVGKGNCTDFHAKFMGVARAAGIPARFTMGIPITPDAKRTAAGYHCWAHFFDGASWIPVDISEAQKVVAKDPAKAEWFFGHLDPDDVRADEESEPDPQ